MSNGKGTLDDLRIDRTALPASQSKTGWVLATIIFAALAGLALWWSVRSKPILVRTVLARSGSGTAPTSATVLNASGYVTARREATISSKVTGKVTEVLVEEGKRVEVGDVLARVDDSNIKISLRLAVSQFGATKSALDETKVRLREAELALKRTTELNKNGIATQADFDTAEAEAQAQQAHLRRLDADGRYDWKVVGVFSAGGGIAESEIWTDAKVLQAAYNRGDSFQSVYAKLTSADTFQPFKDSLTTNPQLNVKVLRQSEYYADQSTSVTRLVTTLGFFIASLMAIGAVFGALNTMYSAVATRTREIATLRALGFGSGPVIASVMLESLLLALAGGLLGGALAYFCFNGFRTATLNWQSFSQVTFAFDVTPQLLVRGIIWAAIIGLIGGLFPAIRATRMPIAAALRQM